ncbi:MAG TPA: HAD family phosphatase [Tepidisphaeraceae bacterium]|nr:HAD family phosphatase [Tepidisphaeraceae bacterium]
MTAWPAAVLFDFDGVIVNSEPLHFDAFQQTLATEHIELSEDEYFRELVGFDDRGAFAHVFKKHGRGLDPKTFLRVMTRKSEMMMELIHLRRYAALGGVEEFVRALWRQYPLAIVSGALREEIEAMLEGVALRDCFPTIVAAEDVTAGKPDPQGYLLGVKLLRERSGKKIEPKDCLVVEDAPSVIKSVRAAGFKTLAVASSYPLERLSDANYAVRRLDIAEVKKQIPQLKVQI